MRQHLKTFAQSVTRPSKVVAEAVIEGNALVKIKHVARKTIDYVAMTPFLRKITFFLVGSIFGGICSFFNWSCSDTNYSFI